MNGPVSRRRTLLALPLVVLAAVAVVGLNYRSTYGIWPFSAASPDRVHVGGRDLLVVEPPPAYRTPDLPCTMQVFLQRPDGRYDLYGLMGGP